MRRNPADDAYTETWQRFECLTLVGRRGRGRMDARRSGVWAGRSGAGWACRDL